MKHLTHLIKWFGLDNHTRVDHKQPYIVDLGLIYECVISTLSSGRKQVDVKMTLTAPGCGMGEVLVQDIKGKVEAIPAVETVNVELVFDPPWNYSMMTDAAKLQTGMY